jgi:Actinobacteria/chloroflexi VLRF1 release factor
VPGGNAADRASGGGRWVEVPPERLVRWVAAFATRHGHTVAEPGPAAVVLRGSDGTVAECHPPFPPIPPAAAGATADPAGQAALMAAHAAADRTVGVLLVRLGGYAAGVFTGAPPRLIASKTGSRLVHGRASAGGWSQHRFARRRENQAAAALRAAATTAVAVIGPHLGRVDAVVLGGDRRAVAGLPDDPQLRAILDRATSRFLTVPDPRLAVLTDTPRQFLAVRIRLTGPGG